MATLSLCMIVKDEERFLERCIESARDLVDEIIVVDTGSKDRTKEIALKSGATVFDFKWKEDFSAARNFSLSKAASNWILVLDADEMLDAEGGAEILKLINDKEHCLKDIIGFKMDQRTYLPKDGSGALTTDKTALEKDFNGFESSKLVRLFKNSKSIMFRNRVHELVEDSIRENNGDVVDTSVVIHHFGHLKKGKLRVKEQDYTDLMWKQLEEDPENPRYNRQVAVAFMEKGRKDLALKYFHRVLKVNPNFPGLFADMAKLYVEMGNTERAIRFFNMAIAKDKKDISSMNNLAVIYMSLGKHNIAKKLLDQALKRDPMNKAVLSNYEKLREKL